MEQDMKWLVIYNCNKLGFPLSGWKIYNSKKEWDEVLEFHSNRKILDFRLFGGKMYKYDNLEEMMEDVDASPIIDKGEKVLNNLFIFSSEDNQFGFYPL